MKDTRSVSSNPCRPQSLKTGVNTKTSDTKETGDVLVCPGTFGKTTLKLVETKDL